MSGRRIKRFLVVGTPCGLTTAETTNWTSYPLWTAVPDLPDLLTRIAAIAGAATPDTNSFRSLFRRLRAL